MEIRYSEWGLGNNYGRYIELNKNLKQYPKLKNYILKHELGHKKEFDILHEFNINFMMFPALFLFVLKYPKTWIDFLPVQIKKKKIIYDINLIILYLVIILIILIVV